MSRRRSAGLAATSLLALLLSGCGGDAESSDVANAQPSSGRSAETESHSYASGNKSKASEPAATAARANPACDTPPVIAPEAVAAFDKRAVLDAHCEVVGLVERTAFDPRLLSSSGEDLEPADLNAWRSHMTPEAQKDWDQNITAALRADPDVKARANVWSLVLFDALTGSGYEFADSSQVSGSTIAPANIYLDEEADTVRLVIAVDVAADLNVVETKTGKQSQLGVSRSLRASLVENPTPAGTDDDWLVASYAADFGFDQPVAR